MNEFQKDTKGESDLAKKPQKFFYLSLSFSHIHTHTHTLPLPMSHTYTHTHVHSLSLSCTLSFFQIFFSKKKVFGLTRSGEAAKIQFLFSHKSEAKKLGRWRSSHSAALTSSLSRHLSMLKRGVFFKLSTPSTVKKTAKKFLTCLH